MRLARAALQRGWKVLRWPGWHLPPGIPDRGAFLYASPLFAERVSELTGLTFSEPDDSWLPRLPSELVRRTIRLTTLEQARGLRQRSFVKPAAFKVFRAGIYDSGVDLPGESEVDGSTPVLLSEVVAWNSEFRFFMLDGRAITGSIYFRDGASAERDGEWPCEVSEFELARALAEKAFSAIPGLLHRSVVIDIGYISDRGWAVIEANPSWGSGLYGADADLALEAISHSVG